MEEEIDELKPIRPIIPVGIQLLLFFLLWFMGAYVGEFLFSIGINLFYRGNPEELDTMLPAILIPRVALHSIFGLLLPAVYFKRITRVRIWDFVHLNFRLKGKWLLICLLGLIGGLYAMEGLSVISQPLRELLPEHYYLQVEEEVQQMNEALFYHKHLGQYLSTLFVFAFLPAVVEEILFRGILFGKLMETSKGNLHFAAIVSGFLFAAVHQNPMDILPIAFMGIGFSYVYHYSKNLSYTILLHFLVNGVQISAVYFFGDYQLF